MVSVAGHELPADDFIAPKRSTMRPKPAGGTAVMPDENDQTDAVAAATDGIRAC